MTKAEIIQEIHKRATVETFFPAEASRLYELIQRLSTVGYSLYKHYPDKLLDLAAQVVRVLEVGR